MITRTFRALSQAAGALALAVGTLTAGAGPAAAAPQPMGQCTTSSGAVLAVDFSKWGGPVYRSCGTTPTTGYELLNQGGWRTTGTGHDGPAFICRIGYSGYQGGKQFPPPSQEDCVLTPPASAYWSYWHAEPGASTWEYSQLGAMLYKPKPGSVDLWIFGGTNVEGTEGRPSVTPDQLRAHNAEPTGGAPQAPDATKKAPALPPGTDTGPAPEHPPVTSSTPSSSPSSATPSASASPSPSASASAGAPPSPAATPTGGSKVVDAAPAGEAAHDTGSFAPVAITAGLVVLIGGAGAYVARRRRRSE
ncbi:LPXTG cell wall anchor domain-containing protein [Streptomyces sp. NPDC007172]|uniref:LPXTG cell wall anchor domain-containing protein n=1 Tax=Streptomyces sp. NPDC007172 TaxID=3364776 RepID=UPI003681AAB3